MVILSICVNGVYTDGFTYHENILPKYQKLIGNDVIIIASQYEYTADCKTEKNDKSDYLDANQIRIIRLPIKNNRGLTFKFKRYKFFYEKINEIKPDIIFCHLFQFLDLEKVIEYVKKNPNVKLFIDNHADFNNSGKNWLSKHILHGIIWRRLAHKALPYTEKFYGVTPARVDFLIDTYKLPKTKVELLPLGADDEIVNKALDPSIRIEKRKEYNLSNSDFVIVTGGKIDHNKAQIISFMEAVNTCGVNNIKLLVFGSVTEELKTKFNEQISDKVQYIGWKSSEDVYYEFAVADLVVFPGLHSVFWEQAVGMGKPCIFKDIQGFHHIDLGGNCLFFEKDDIEEYKTKTYAAMENINKMKSVAEEKGIRTFSYAEIAKKSLQID